MGRGCEGLVGSVRGRVRGASGREEGRAPWEQESAVGALCMNGSLITMDGVFLVVGLYEERTRMLAGREAGEGPRSAELPPLCSSSRAFHPFLRVSSYSCSLSCDPLRSGRELKRVESRALSGPQPRWSGTKGKQRTEIPRWISGPPRSKTDTHTEGSTDG